MNITCNISYDLTPIEIASGLTENDIFGSYEPGNVLRYKAVSDGSVSTNVELNKAHAGAGINGTVLYPPSSTFLIDGAVDVLSGQTIIGYGAKLKRINEVSTTTTTPIVTSGNAVITVTSTVGFKVGMDCGFFNGATFDVNNHEIVSIVGNDITLGTTFTTAFPSGGTLVSATHMLFGGVLGDDGIKVLGIEIDGNRANNTLLRKWTLQSEMHLSGANCLIQGCYVHDAVVEGLVVFGENFTVRENRIIDCGGNGVHFSATGDDVTAFGGGKAIGNHVKNCNLLGIAPGHQDGCIIFSNGTRDSIVDGNYIENGISGVGSIDSDDNSGMVITNNIIKDMTSYGIEIVVPTAELAGRILIANNQIINSVDVRINWTGSSFDITKMAYEIVFSNNYLEDTKVLLDNVRGMIFSDNILNYPTLTTLVLLTISECVRLSILNNHLVGGINGINANGANNQGWLIQGNTFKNSTDRAINIGAITCPGCAIIGNLFIQESGFTTTGWDGVILPQRATFSNNTMDIQVTAGSDGVFGHSSGCYIMDNVIRSSGLANSIRIAGGAVNGVMINNLTQQAISDGSAGGYVNTGNLIIT